MISVKELKEWLSHFPDDEEVGIDDGGLTLQTLDGLSYVEIGGLPEEDSNG